ncbi:hypothetical protein LEP1GSC116_4847 [Leptospira interrogans serovar Icterohaemorrhagiae str. Verdun HP]|uniref:Lipoprotein n=3 Tax=Leptospira interrogans TaxID=173 RepID=M6R6S3_LEPIR|nr:hypothetical protein LEP1GSC150_4994 [Leptospira interrogans serovar Copenhageni str. LT2050]EMO03842.1 hypothetical protein LEP1GSC116_4847 [Leptospira interrogans serovar Icterohaemorrhagiae str. Verdun HP]EMY26309.1 hypothetical protein LEP1GSC115_5554 [Leptospira interrogans serovar Australis str. 200703203]
MVFSRSTDLFKGINRTEETMKQIAILTALIIFTSCASVESKRSVSASGDPSEIFLKKKLFRWILIQISFLKNLHVDLSKKN